MGIVLRKAEPRDGLFLAYVVILLREFPVGDAFFPPYRVFSSHDPEYLLGLTEFDHRDARPAKLDMLVVIAAYARNGTQVIAYQLAQDATARPVQDPHL